MFRYVSYQEFQIFKLNVLDPVIERSVMPALTVFLMTCIKDSKNIEIIYRFIS